MIFKRYMHKYAGGSTIKCYIEKKRTKRKGVSLFHQPVYSPNSKNLIDWRYCTPKSGYEYMYIYGENTIEITNLPNNKVNEYVQERLRKSLNKYGRLKIIRCLSKKNDPYVNNNVCYATFLNKRDMNKCIKNLHIRFPFSLQSKIIKLKSLLTNKTNDYNYFFKQDHYNYSVINIALNLFKHLQKKSFINIKNIYMHIFEYSFNTHKIITAGISVYKVFGNWEHFIDFFDSLFIKTIINKEINETQVNEILVSAHVVSDEQLAIILNNKLIQLKKKTNDINSVYWRENALQLPQEIENRLNNEHPKKLKEELQILSKTKDFYKIHDERHLFKLKLNRERKERKLMRKKELENMQNIQQIQNT